MSRPVCTVNRPPVVNWTCMRILAYRSRTANKPATTSDFCGLMIGKWESQSNQGIKHMKRLFLAAFAIGMIGCANQPAPPPGPAVTGGYPYSRYAHTADVWGHRSPAYRDWSTAQLQQRRLDLYATVPFTRTRNEVPAYIYNGMALPQQDEIKAIETELNWRYQHGDKTAELKEFWPSTRRHIASGARFDSGF